MRNGLKVDSEGTKWYFKNDKLHREDGPAVEWTDGDKFWYLNGKHHREDGPGGIISHTRCWYLDNIDYGENKPKNWNELVAKSCAKRLLDE